MSREHRWLTISVLHLVLATANIIWGDQILAQVQIGISLMCLGFNQRGEQ